MILKHTTQLLILLLVVSLISVTAISTIFYVFQIDSQREQLSVILESISHIGSDNISKWLDERKTNVQNLAESRLLITSVKDLKNPELSSQEIFQSRLGLESISADIHNSWYWLEGLKISDHNTGEMIFEFRDAPTENLSEQQHFIDALNGNVAISEIYSSEGPIINEFGEYEKDVPTLLISAPISSDTGLDGILTARVNVFKMYTGITEHVTNFHSGDAFMVNSDGFFLSRSAFPQEIVNLVERRPELELRVFDPANQDFTKLFQNADKNKVITIVDGYNDYRGISVIGSINSIQDTDWFFIFEIDESEAYQEFTRLQIMVGYSLSILTIVVFVTSSHFAKAFSRPIISLKESAEEMTSGNLDSPIKAKGPYEISKLSGSMEQMRKILKKQIEELKQADKTKTLFLNNLSHELKSPLVPIIGYCEMLLNPKFGELNDEQLDAVNKIGEYSSLLLRNSDNFLKLQQITENKLSLKIKKVNVDELKEIISKISLGESKKNFKLETTFDKELSINADKSELIAIFTELIQNTTDFLPEKGGKIEIGAKEQNGNVLFSVKDNGIGISKEKLTEIFKPFIKVDMSQSRTHDGVGLGLALCKGLVEVMKGKIWVESIGDKGATFFFTIPKAD